jgi:hypothetical protein
MAIVPLVKSPFTYNGTTFQSFEEFDASGMGVPGKIFDTQINSIVSDRNEVVKPAIDVLQATAITHNTRITTLETNGGGGGGGGGGGVSIPEVVFTGATNGDFATYDTVAQRLVPSSQALDFEPFFITAQNIGNSVNTTTTSTVSWGAKIGDAGYVILWANASAVWSPKEALIKFIANQTLPSGVLGTRVSGATSYTITGLTQGTTYAVVVASLDKNEQRVKYVVPSAELGNFKVDTANGVEGDTGTAVATVNAQNGAIRYDLVYEVANIESFTYPTKITGTTSPTITTPALPRYTTEKSIQSQVRASNVVTVQSTGHGLSVKDTIHIFGTDANFRGYGVIVNSVINADSFTYFCVGTNATATGTYTFKRPLFYSWQILAIQADSTLTISQLSRSSGIATATTQTPHSLVVGAIFTIANVNEAGFNGTFRITQTTTNTFTFLCAGVNTTATGNNMQVLYSTYVGKTGVINQDVCFKYYARITGAGTTGERLAYNSKDPNDSYKTEAVRTPSAYLAPQNYNDLVFTSSKYLPVQFIEKSPFTFVNPKKDGRSVKVYVNFKDSTESDVLASVLYCEGLDSNPFTTGNKNGALEFDNVVGGRLSGLAPISNNGDLDGNALRSDGSALVSKNYPISDVNSCYVINRDYSTSTFRDAEFLDIPTKPADGGNVHYSFISTIPFFAVNNGANRGVTVYLLSKIYSSNSSNNFLKAIWINDGVQYEQTLDFSSIFAQGFELYGAFNGGQGRHIAETNSIDTSELLLIFTNPQLGSIYRPYFKLKFNFVSNTCSMTSVIDFTEQASTTFHPRLSASLRVNGYCARATFGVHNNIIESCYIHLTSRQVYNNEYPFTFSKTIQENNNVIQTPWYHPADYSYNSIDGITNQQVSQGNVLGYKTFVCSAHSNSYTPTQTKTISSNILYISTGNGVID